VLTLFMVFGIAFEVPVAVVVLARMGMVTIEQLKQFRGYFIVGAFIVAAVVTPPDVISQLALAIPMCILYEVGIIAARRSSSSTPGAADETPDRQDLSAARGRARSRRHGGRCATVTFSSSALSPRCTPIGAAGGAAFSAATAPAAARC
jgi:hypothetical protein